MTDSHVLVRVDADTAWVRICGRATFAIGQPMREFVITAVRTGIHHFLVDATECTSMDSTFMGVLTMVAQPGQSTSAAVEIVNASDRVARQFADLGIRDLFAFTRRPTASGVCQETELSGKDLSSDDVRGTMIAAHETLEAADPANVAKFRDLLDFLKAPPKP